jgi:hypothetical protein
MTFLKHHEMVGGHNIWFLFLLRRTKNRKLMKKQSPMLLDFLLITTNNNKQSQVARTTATISTFIMFLLLAVAVYLAVKDMKYLPKTSTKIWVLLLSILAPEVYVILHGISSSSQGISFFEGNQSASLLPETLSTGISPI